MSVQFDGTTARLATAGVPTTGAITLMGWFYNATTPAAAQTWFSLQSAAFATGYLYVGVTAAGYVYVAVFDDAGNFREVQEFTLKADPASWVHVALVRNGSNPIQVILSVLQRGIDAQQVVALTGTGTLGTITPVALYLGGDDLNGDATPDELFSGAATQVRLWQAALTRTEIRAERDAAVAVRTANLYLDTPLSVFTDLTDVSGNGNNWTAIGTISTGTMAAPVQPWPTSFTKFYVNNGINAYGTAQSQIGPWNSTSVSGGNLSPYKYADSTGGIISRTGSETSSSPTFKRLITRLATNKLAAQTISGTLDVCLGVTESNADADFYWAVTAWVAYTDPVSGALGNRGTLIYDYTEDSGTGTEWPTTNTATGFTAPIPVTPVACLAGDWIQIEIGYIARNALTASRTGTLRTGAATSGVPTGTVYPDLTPGSVNTLAEVGWVQFSNALTPFVAAPLNLSAATATVIAPGNPTVAAPYLDSQANAQMAGWGMGGRNPTCATATTGHYAESWYQWTPSVTGTARFDLLVGAQSYLRVYTGPADNLVEVGCIATFSRRTISFAVTSGTPYHVVSGHRFMPGASGTGGAASGQDFRLYVPVAPTNNSCATGIVVVAGALPYTNQQDASLAVETVGSPPASVNSFVNSSGRALWWIFTPAVSGNYEVDTLGTVADCQMTVWTGACGSLIEYSNVPWLNYATSESSGVLFSEQPKLVFAGVAGTAYYIVVSSDENGSASEPDPGLTAFALRAVTAVNDTAATAYGITALPTFVAQSNNASQDLPKNGDLYPSCGDQSDQSWEGKYLWYKWTATEAAEVQVNTAPSWQVGTGVAVYTGSPGALVRLTCAKMNFAGNFRSNNAQVIFTPVVGTTYYFQVFADGRTWATLNLFIDRTDRGVLGGDIIIGCGAIFIYTPEGAIRDYLFLNGYTFSGIPTNGSFDPADETQLYVSQFGANQIVQVDTTRVPMTLVKYTPTAPGNLPEGNAFRREGQLLTGFRSSTNPADDLREYAVPVGTLSQTWNPTVEDEGTGWIDLAMDRRTVYYTSAARSVLRFDVQTSQQLPAFATLPASGLGPLYAQGIRILPDGGVAVADYSQVTRTDASGTTSQVYAIPINTDVHVLDVAPDGLSIWVGVTIGNHVYRVQLSDGSILAHWIVPAVSNLLCGLAVRDGLRAIDTICPVIGAFTVIPVTPTCPGVPGEL